MKTVYLRGRSGGGPIHSIYQELIRFPPEGYRFVTDNFETMRQQQLEFNLFRIIENTSFIRELWHEFKTLQYMGIKKVQSLRTESKFNADLVYASQQLLSANFPWIVDFEYANALVNYGDIRLGRAFVKKALSSKYCRKILPWSDWAKRTLFRSLNCDFFKEKIETLHFAVSPKSFSAKKDGDKVRLLFVGSTNLFNLYNFEWKGGFETVEAFFELSKKYDNLELIVRSWVPSEIQEKCANKQNVKILSSILPEKELAQLYASSDIFVFPSYLNLGMAILEAMSYELPVVAVNLYDIPEAVQDMKTGMLLTPPPNVPFYIWNGAPNHYDRKLLQKIRQARPWMVNQIVEKVSLLIENSSLRRDIGRNARHLVERGKFSVKKRNEKLKRIFDEAIAL